VVAAVGPRYRALILLATFSSLRWSELAALTVHDIDLDACTVRVTRELNHHWGGYSFGPPKSRAGRRVVDFADLIVPDLRKHLDVLPDGAPLVFTSPTDSPLVNSKLPGARAAAHARGRRPGRYPLPRPAPYRHHFTAEAGANPKELMARMGHASPRAALIYLHSSGKRQWQLADAVGKAAGRAAGAGERIRTADHPLFRRNPMVAECRLVWLNRLSSWSDCRLRTAGVG
jgi:integrase